MGYFKGNNLPVECVSPKEIMIFCEKLSRLTTKKYRLPSEAEWEYTCRAGTTTAFYLGDNINTDIANYHVRFEPEITVGKTTEIGQFPPNAFGLYDMHGNVCECCQDGYNGDYCDHPIDGSPFKKNYLLKVIRGGSWKSIHKDTRSASRFKFGDLFANPSEDTGFRIAMSIT